jgi:acetyltransferase-like isoleucine patch superfamily enzyme
MKKFTKLVLVSSMAISANAMAMQAMDDAALSSTTGQDGINIGIGISKIQIDKVFVHDNDGLSPTKTDSNNVTSDIAPGTAGFGGSNTAGAIGIDGITITGNMNSLLTSHNLMDLQIDSDAGKNGAFLNIAAQVSGLNIKIGEISVAASGSDVTGRRGVVAGSEKAILSGLTITTGKMNANIQLGSTPQGAMIKLDTVMEGGLEISDLGILDNANNGQIWLGKISVNDAKGKDLTIKSDVNVKANGLELISAQNTDGTDIYVQAIALGAKPTATLGERGTATAGSIGDVEVQGLKTYYVSGGTAAAPIFAQGSKITITGR